MDKRIINNKEYQIIKLLGHGKGGYSYLAKHNDSFVVLKQIHHEPCSYYNFGDKIQAELHDYQRLVIAKINVPKLIDVDINQEVIIKEYIEGKTIFDLVKDGENIDKYIITVKEMANLAKQAGLNIDYFPTNFVVRNDELFYIDYECNNYMEEWNYENWGQKYWSRTQEFLDYIKNHNN